MAVTFEQLMQGFGSVTVMNACIFVPKTAYTAAKNCKSVVGEDNKYSVGSAGMAADEFVPAYEYIDTLKIANLTQEGPTKTISGGQYANPLIKYGKTMTAEMQDALGRASTLARFFGCDYDGYQEGYLDADGKAEIKGVQVGDTVFVRINGQPADNKVSIKSNADTGVMELVSTDDKAAGAFYTVSKKGSRLSVTDKFPGPFAIEGDTFFIDQKTGEKKHVFILIPQFIPDAILTLTQDAEGDATVFDLNGSLGVTTIADTTTVGEGDQAKKVEINARDIFYEIRDTSFFAEQRKRMVVPGDDNYSTGAIEVGATPTVENQSETSEE